MLMNMIMKYLHICSLCHILLSAIMFSIAFLCPDRLGVLIVFSWFPLGYFFLIISEKLKKYYILFFGFFWGVIIYAVHFVWLYVLLNTKSHATKPLGLLLYIAMVVYFSSTAGIWFLFTDYVLRCFRHVALIVRCFLYIILTIIYFLFLEYFSLFIFGRLEGYSFLNPLIPLARYKIVLLILSWVTTLLYVPEQLFDKQVLQTSIYHLIHVKPKKSGICSRDVQELFHQVARKAENNQHATSKVLLVLPESSFPFPINNMKSVFSLLSTPLKDNMHLLIGSQYENNDGKLYQSIYWLKSEGVVGRYNKTHVVPFVEKMPSFFKKCTILKNIFLQKSCELSSSEQNDFSNKEFHIDDNLLIIPCICSELFFTKNVNNFVTYRKMNHKDVKIFFFVNDSWFVHYFQKIMNNLTYIKSALIGLPIVYIGYSSCHEISI